MCLLISVRVNVSVWQENECVSTVCDGFPSEIVSHAVFIKEGIVGDCPWLTGEREHSRQLFHRDVYQWITVGKVGSHTSTCSEVGLIFHVFVQSCQPLLTAFLHSHLNPALCEQGCLGVNNLLSSRTILIQIALANLAKMVFLSRAQRRHHLQSASPESKRRLANGLLCESQGSGPCETPSFARDGTESLSIAWTRVNSAASRFLGDTGQRSCGNRPRLRILRSLLYPASDAGSATTPMFLRRPHTRSCPVGRVKGAGKSQIE